jgi:tetratricopeptide (TPR) repeat protein
LETHNDFVRIEVEDGLARGIPVIPVLVQGAAMPREDQLPATLAPLAYRNGLEVRGDPHFHRDADQLIEQLAPILASTATLPPEPFPEHLAHLNPTRAVTAAAPPSQATVVPAAEALPVHTPAISPGEVGRDDRFTTAETDILEGTEVPDAGIEEAPPSLAAWLREGKASLVAKRLEEALTAFEEALAIDGNSALAWSGKAIALKQLGRYEEAGFAARCAQLGAILARRRAEGS